MGHEYENTCNHRIRNAKKNGTFFRKLNLNLKVNSDPETIGLQTHNFYH